MDALRTLWTETGLDTVKTRAIAVQRTFADFEDFWTIGLTATTIRANVATMAPSDVETLKQRVRARLPADAAGRLTTSACANAIKGRVPKS